MFWFVFACILLSTTATIMAKYYAKESRKGVATASGLYFTSNYLEQISDDVLPERANTNQWLGSGTCNLNIEIYNYSNILLYNDENLNITECERPIYIKTFLLDAIKKEQGIEK